MSVFDIARNGIKKARY